MGSSTASAVAVVLAAGDGGRFATAQPRSKLLIEIGGVPIIAHTLTALFEAGIRRAHVVLGFDAERVCTAACLGAPGQMRLTFHLNEQWREKNARSLLAVRSHVDAPFALLLADHLFESAAIRRFLCEACRDAETLISVDSRPTEPEVSFEAIKVKLRGDRVVEVDRRSFTYDALATGMFRCSPGIFDTAEEMCREGHTALSGTFDRLTAVMPVRAVEVGDSAWCDIDSVDQATADRWLRRA